MFAKQQPNKKQSPQLNLGDSLLIVPPQDFELTKCNTPDMQRKNLFDMAKNTVDKVKHNVKIKRKEFINMVYSSNEGYNSDDDEGADELLVYA